MLVFVVIVFLMMSETALLKGPAFLEALVIHYPPPFLSEIETFIIMLRNDRVVPFSGSIL